MNKIISHIVGRLKKFFLNHQIPLLFGIATGVSIGSLIYYYNKGLILAYGDAESHLNIAKRVVSSITPGFGQLGAVWLPLQHILMIPFIWNDYLWRSGLAGSFVSMAAFIVASIFIFKLTKFITKRDFPSWLAAILFISNPNILYMQSVPLGELPLIAALIGAVYFMCEWIQSNSILSLIFSAIFVLAGSLIRYDAWFLCFFEVLVVFTVTLLKYKKLKKTEGNLILFSSVAFLGISFWIGWNTLIFQNPFYFLTSPYSAKSQQLRWLARNQLPSYNNIFNSVSVYSLTVIKNAGIILFVITLCSLFVVILRLLIKKSDNKNLLGLLLLLVPFPFYVLTLYLGISIILVPELIPHGFDFNIFNIRYGLMIVPAVAVLTAYLFSISNKWLKTFLFLIILIQFGLFTAEKYPIVVQDGLLGFSARRPPSLTNNYLSQNYDYGKVLFDDYSRTANPVDLGVSMENIIYVGNHPYWEESLERPTTYIRWFIIKHEENEMVWSKLQNNNEFLANYSEVFTAGNTSVYKRI